MTGAGIFDIKNMHRHEKHFPHNQTLLSLIDSFKQTKLSGALTALYSNRVIQQIAAALVGLFLPILLYINLDNSFYKVLAFFALSFLLWLFLVPLGAMAMSKIGIRKSIVISIVFGLAWYYLLQQFSLGKPIVYLGLALVAITIYRCFYWVPFHTDFAEFTDKRTRGRQLAFLMSVSLIVSVFIPVLAGLIIANYGYEILFLIAITVYLLSIIPVFLLPKVQEKFSYTYFQTFKQVFSKKHRNMLISYAADGAQNVSGIVVWPIFIWLIMNQNYAAVGLISSLIILFSLILQLFMGNLSDRFDKRKVLKWGARLNAAGWIIKMFVQTGFQIFIASTYHSFASIVMRTPYDALMYERAADSGHYVDEYTVLREISLGIGRLIMIAAIALIFLITGSMGATFLAAALASLLVSVL